MKAVLTFLSQLHELDHDPPYSHWQLVHRDNPTDSHRSMVSELGPLHFHMDSTIHMVLLIVRTLSQQPAKAKSSLSNWLQWVMNQALCHLISRGSTVTWQEACSKIKLQCSWQHKCKRGREEKETMKSIKPVFVSLKVFLIYNVLECSCHPAVQPWQCCLLHFFFYSSLPPHWDCHQFLLISSSYSKWIHLWAMGAERQRWQYN